MAQGFGTRIGTRWTLRAALRVVTDAIGAVGVQQRAETK